MYVARAAHLESVNFVSKAAIMSERVALAISIAGAISLIYYARRSGRSLIDRRQQEDDEEPEREERLHRRSSITPLPLVREKTHSFSGGDQTEHMIEKQHSMLGADRTSTKDDDDTDDAKPVPPASEDKKEGKRMTRRRSDHSGFATAGLMV